MIDDMISPCSPIFGCKNAAEDKEECSEFCPKLKMFQVHLNNFLTRDVGDMHHGNRVSFESVPLADPSFEGIVDHYAGITNMLVTCRDQVENAGLLADTVGESKGAGFRYNAFA